jgi:hypothetical protein
VGSDDGVTIGDDGALGGGGASAGDALGEPHAVSAADARNGANREARKRERNGRRFTPPIYAILTAP